MEWENAIDVTWEWILFCARYEGAVWTWEFDDDDVMRWLRAVFLLSSVQQYLQNRSQHTNNTD